MEKTVKVFTENDLYVITYLNKINDKVEEDEFVIIGEVEAHKWFDTICNAKIHDEVVLSKGKIFKLNNSVCGYKEIRRWKDESEVR